MPSLSALKFALRPAPDFSFFLTRINHRVRETGYFISMPAPLEPATLDVRPLLAQGIDPLSAITEAKQQLQPGQVLVLRAPFEPLPLYELFEAEGYEIRPQQQAEDDWEIRFTPSPGEGNSAERELDLRMLEPPAPLQKALEAVQSLGRDERLILHTRFHPVHILEQIDAETTDYDCEEIGANHWVTTLWRISA